MNKVKAFFKGMQEFRMDYTTNPGEHLIEIYNSGRELAHTLTFRKFD